MGIIDLLSTTNEQRRGVSEIYVHPNFTVGSYDWDIALIRVSQPFAITDYVRTICVPLQDMESFYDEGTSCTLTGWGHTAEGGKISLFNAFHAAGEYRRQVKKWHKIFKNDNILEFHDTWNHHGKCIQISTNMPGIGSLIRELDVTFLKFEKANTILQGHFKSINWNSTQQKKIVQIVSNHCIDKNRYVLKYIPIW